MNRLVWKWQDKVIYSVGEYRHGATHVLYSERGYCLGSLGFDVMLKQMEFFGYTTV